MKNDIWQGVSWSSIEYSGRWKVLNYGMSQIFSPVIIYPFWDADSQQLNVTIISDRLEKVTGFAQITWYTWGGEQISTEKFNFTTAPLNNSLLLSVTGLDNILPNGTKAEDVWLLLNATADTDSGTVTNEQYVSSVQCSCHVRVELSCHSFSSSLPYRWHLQI